jgi:hypothetical protein
MEAQPVEENSKEIRNFCTRRSAIGVELIYDQMEYVALVGCKPVTGRAEDGRLDASHQHDIQHAVICDEDIRRLILHVPPGPHFRAGEVLKEPRGVRIPCNCLGICLD